MILFGARSPLVVDFEETLARKGIALAASVSVGGAARVIDRTRLIDLAEFVPESGAEFLAPAFAPLRRAALIAQAEALGLIKAAALIDPTAVLPRSIRIGAGSYINAGVVIGAMSMLGEGVLINRAASLGHHTVLADLVSVGPGATLAGNIHVGAGSVIGAGAVVLPNVRIGAGTIVSAGAVVRKHVPDGVLVIGNPAAERRFNPRLSSLNVEDGE
ncbi:MAG: acetyltransferase [Novosphingobium sp.]|uniref:acetyltransferase n=1 Tax=Novosphingobium sp. TaxID=1874826 RepID=UPI0032BDF0F8